MREDLLEDLENSWFESSRKMFVHKQMFMIHLLSNLLLNLKLDWV